MKKKITDLNARRLALYLGTYFSLALSIVFGSFTFFAKINNIDHHKPLRFFFITALAFVIFKPLLYKDLGGKNS